MVIFYDETTENVLPPGILVQIYGQDASQTPENVLYSGYIGLGGILNQSVQGAVAYTAVFQGTQAPNAPQDFQGNALPGADTIVTVDGYRSPTLTAAGYRDELINLFPKDRANDTARSPGGVVYAQMGGIGAVLAALDANQQKILASERLPTCVDPKGGPSANLDSWAYDFFGNYLLRFLGETDQIYYSRVLAGLGPRCTLAAIEQVVNQFYLATVAVRALEQDENLAYDIIGAFNVSGGFDIYAAPPSLAQLIPAVKVWDAQSNPTLAAQYGIAPPQFVVNIGFSGVQGWFLDHSHLDIETFLIDGNEVTTSTTPPDPRLGALVNLVKGGGTQPLYQTYSTT